MSRPLLALLSLVSVAGLVDLRAQATAGYSTFVNSTVDSGIVSPPATFDLSGTQSFPGSFGNQSTKTWSGSGLLSAAGTTLDLASSIESFTSTTASTVYGTLSASDFRTLGTTYLDSLVFSGTGPISVTFSLAYDVDLALTGGFTSDSNSYVSYETFFRINGVTPSIGNRDFTYYENVNGFGTGGPAFGNRTTDLTYILSPGDVISLRTYATVASNITTATSTSTASSSATGSFVIYISDLSEGASFVAESGHSYATTVIPEPSVYAALLSGLALGFVVRRRRSGRG